MQFSLSDIAQVTNGALHGEDRRVDGLSIDSRLTSSGQLFAAVTGDRDGHSFVASALAIGAGGALVERIEADYSEGPVVVVPHMTSALESLARAARSRLGDRVVGVTGSLGKTTTKDMLASVLAQRFVTSASSKSFNNELGVPITLMNAPDGTEATVVEMGARGEGHIAYLCSMAVPTIGVITTVEAVHTETMGGIDAIASVKGELIESLPPDGLAVLNSDVKVVAALAERSPAAVLTFGRTGEVRARGVVLDDELVPSFVIVSPWGEVSVRLGIRGAHNVMNALAAAAVGLSLGVSLDELAGGLETSQNSPWRMELHRLPSGAALINDCYNASPASTRAALEALAALDGGESARRFAVLGVMAELGDRSIEEHRDIASIAADLEVRIIAVGTDLYGVDPVHDPAGALEVLRSLSIEQGDAVLVKGSRVAGLEVIADSLVAGS